MKVEYEIVSYDVTAGRYLEGKRLEQGMVLPNKSDAITVAQLLKNDGYGVMLTERREETSIHRTSVHITPVLAEYSFRENNSGGGWWLDLRDYEALEKAGWTLVKDEWRDQPRSATVMAKSLEDAIASWEKATGKSYDERGCDCCGQPYSIMEW